MATTKRVRIDQVDYDEVPLQAAQAFERKAGELDQAIATLKSDRAAVEAREQALLGKLDAATAELKKAQAAVAAKSDPKAIDALVAARVDLVGKARGILGEDFKADGMSDREVKAAAVAKASAGFKAEGKSDDYINARFDAVCEAAEAEGGLAAVRRTINDTAEETLREDDLNSDPYGKRTDALSSPTFRKWSQDAWKTPLSASKRTHKIDGADANI